MLNLIIILLETKQNPSIFNLNLDSVFVVFYTIITFVTNMKYN